MGTDTGAAAGEGQAGFRRNVAGEVEAFGPAVRVDAVAAAGAVDDARGQRPVAATVTPVTALPSPDLPVRTAAELTDRWAGLLAPPTFRRRDLWVAWLDASGLMLPLILPIEDVPLVPERALLLGLLDLHDAVVGEHLGDGGHLALALCRPGSAVPRDDDGEWVAALQHLLDDQIDEPWSLHLAAGGAVRALVLPPWGPFRR